MKYNIISTGSVGNAVVINDKILIDCGVPFKKLKPVVKGLKLVLLTHVHSDHFNPSTAATLHRERPALRFGCCEWMVEPLLKSGVSKRVIDVYDLESGRSYNSGRTAVFPVALTHNVKNCGYCILDNFEGLFYATDASTLDGIKAPNCDLYMIEANHAKAELEARVAEKKAAGEYSYEMDAARNHLSREQALDWLYQQMGPNSKYVFLHQHIDRKEAAAHDSVDSSVLEPDSASEGNEPCGQSGAF